MTKIEALEKTIYNLENDVFEYCWSSMYACNCGILAKTLLGGMDGMNSIWDINPTRTQNIGFDCFSDRTHCLQTSEPLPKVFEALRSTGFTDDEMRSLEFLSNPQITATSGYLRHNSKEALIIYLKAWVEILKEEKMIEEQEVKRSVATNVQSELQTLETQRKHLPTSTIFYEEVEEKLDLKIKGLVNT